MSEPRDTLPLALLLWAALIGPAAYVTADTRQELATLALPAVTLLVVVVILRGADWLARRLLAPHTGSHAGGERP